MPFLKILEWRTKVLVIKIKVVERSFHKVALRALRNSLMQCAVRKKMAPCTELSVDRHVGREKM